ncbi:MAG: hypothetical protein WCP39_03215 [Chlamydiota bacterium]
MIDTSTSKKIKIHLSDYDYQKDIENRLLMSELSSFDLKVLEEIVYSSLHIPISKLAKTMETSEDFILPVVKKFSKVGLLVIENDTLSIDKQMRKYYEFQIIRYSIDFKPDLEFLQGLLKKVPIHVLPSWYSISRSTDNIFESILEKYLRSPQAFHRYLQEFTCDTILWSIIQDVYSAPDCKVFAHQLQKKYQISKHKFEEYMLLLEYGLVCCSSYTQVDNNWEEIITPFQEWKEYLLFLKKTEAPSILDSILHKRTSPFAFIEDMSFLLDFLESKNLPDFSKHSPLSIPEIKNHYRNEISPLLDNQLILAQKKLVLLDLANHKNDALTPSKSAKKWKSLSLEKKALHNYLHPKNRILSIETSEKNSRDAEKSILRALDAGWIYFDDFLLGVTSPLHEDHSIKLKRTGKSWRYELPSYTPEEKEIIKHTIFESLFEVGMTSIGIHNQKDCFCVTPFGKKFFES